LSFLEKTIKPDLARIGIENTPCYNPSRNKAMEIDVLKKKLQPR
jgi:hypothetical protein